MPGSQYARRMFEAGVREYREIYWTACRQANRGAYIQSNGYEAVPQGQVVSFISVRPERNS